MTHIERTSTVAWVLFWAMACGPHDATPPPPLETTGAGGCATCSADAGGGGSGGGSIDAGADGTMSEGGVVPGDGGDLGKIVIVDVPNAPCRKSSATPVTVMESEPLLITYDQAGMAGTRRFALDPNTLSMLTFDSDGASPSPIVAGILSARATPDGSVATLTSGGQGLALRMYDSAGTAAGADVELTRDAAGTPTLATGPASLLALWESNDALHGRLSSNGKLGASVEFGADSCGMSNCIARAVYNGRGFTVVWSRVEPNERARTSFADVTLDGKVNFVKPVLLSDGYHRVIDVVFSGSSYALLLGEGYPTRDPVVVFLDAYGNVMPPGRRLLGSTEAWGIAALAGGFGVVAGLSDGRAALRSLTGAGEAPDGWVCLDDSEPNIGFSAHAAIYGEPSGYGFVVRMTDGSAALLRTDARGAPR